MTTKILARMQNRRGLRKDLPQPLLPGELGLCLDTGQVFIGADPYDPASIVTPTIKIYRDYFANVMSFPSSNISDHVDFLLGSVYVLSLATTNVLPSLNTDEESPSATRVMFPVTDENGDVSRVIVAVDTVTSTFPQIGEIGAEVSAYWPLSDDISFTAVSEVELPPSYSVFDAASIARAINRANEFSTLTLAGTEKSLVTVAQNVELKTDAFVSYDERLSTIMRTLPESVYDDVSLYFSATDADSMIITYSAAVQDYRRIGELRITNNGTDVSISDNYDEMGISPANLQFYAEISGSSVTLKYSYSNASSPNISVNFNIRKWSNSSVYMGI